MSLYLPRLPRSFRWWVILWAGAIFLWISLEDTRTLPVALLGTGSVVLYVTSRILTRLGGKSVAGSTMTLGIPLVGALTGLASAVCTAVLMFFKTAIHAHVFPDYPPSQILAMLERAPVWAAAGSLIGCAVVFAVIGLHSGVNDERLS